MIVWMFGTLAISCFYVDRFLKRERDADTETHVWLEMRIDKDGEMVGD